MSLTRGEILELMKYEPHSDYRAEVLFDMLYEYVYEARLENKPLHDRGLVITRSFEPSISRSQLRCLIQGLTNTQKTLWVSLSAVVLLGKTRIDNESVNPDFKVYQRFYDEYNEEFRFVGAQVGAWKHVLL